MQLSSTPPLPNNKMELVQLVKDVPQHCKDSRYGNMKQRPLSPITIRWSNINYETSRKINFKRNKRYAFIRFGRSIGFYSIY